MTPEDETRKEPQAAVGRRSAGNTVDDVLRCYNGFDSRTKARALTACAPEEMIQVAQRAAKERGWPDMRAMFVSHDRLWTGRL